MGKNLDLLLINIGKSKKRANLDLSKNFSAIEPPFWAALTASYIRNKNFGVDIIDANAENLTHIETAKKISEANPKLTNIVVYGLQPASSTPLMTSVGELCKEIKKNEPERKIILTGLHPSALPERTLKEECCDFVGQGEGFVTLDYLLKGEDHNKIPGLWWKEGDIIKGNERAKNITNLSEELNGVAWDLLPMDKYFSHNWHSLGDLNLRKNYASINTSLGCSYKCDFCAIWTTFGERKIRNWSQESVLTNIDELVKKYNVKNLKIIDELFIFNPKHFMPIVESLIERDYKLNIWAYARIDTMKKEYLPKLKKAGFNWLAYGTETGNDKLRSSVGKGQFTKEDIKRVVKETKEEGINIVGHALFGLPGETYESMQENLNFAMELNCEWETLFPIVYYPGSNLYSEKLKENTQMPKKWADFTPHSYNFKPFPTENLTSSQILEFRDFAFDIYYKNPRYLNMIENKFGKKARDHLREMVKTKFKRKILGD